MHSLVHLVCEYIYLFVYLFIRGCAYLFICIFMVLDKPVLTSRKYPKLPLLLLISNAQCDSLPKGLATRTDGYTTYARIFYTSLTLLKEGIISVSLIAICCLLTPFIRSLTNYPHYLIEKLLSNTVHYQTFCCQFFFV